MTKLTSRLFLLLPLLASLSAEAQMTTSDEPQRPSADAWEFIQQGNVTPDLHTGTLRLSIPFFTYKDPDFEFPISLDYATNGCVPNVVPGVLGPGWTLSVGGVITREIRGQADDKNGNVCESSVSILPLRSYIRLHQSSVDPDYAEMYHAWDNFLAGEKCYYRLPPESGSNVPVCYDAEPDIFHFSIPGHSGTFHLGPGGAVHVYGTSSSPDCYRIEISTDHNLSTPITITTSDGYRYEFKGLIGNRNLGNTDYIYTDASTIVCWKLSRIVAPNGRKVEFSYQYTPGVHNFRPYANCWNIMNLSPAESSSSFNRDGMKLADSECIQTVLSEIRVDGDTLAVFDYAPSVSEKYHRLNGRYNNESDYTTKSVPGKLEGIRIRYGGKDVRSCTMSYDYGTKSGTGFLSSVTVAGEGTYSMEYYKKDQYPMYGTFKVDHWGYYNGMSSRDTTFLGATIVDADNNENIRYDSPRLPNLEYSKIGVLTKIIYPTGGWSSFAYGQHRYAKEVKTLSSYGFKPVVLGSRGGSCGGVRIEKVENCESDGKILSSTEYEYRVGTTDTGILTYMPRYRVDFVAAQAGVYHSGSFWSNNLTRLGDTHIEYESVTEKRPDGSRVRHFFHTFAERPDYTDFRGLRAESNKVLGAYTVWPSELAGLFVPRSRNPSRGKHFATDFLDASGNVVAGEGVVYDELVPDLSLLTWTPQYLFFSTAEAGVYVGREDVVSSTRSLRFGSSEQSRTTSYGYNSHFLRDREEVSDSRGVKTVTRLEYVTDASSGVEKMMADAGFIDSPTRESVYVSSGTGPETLVMRADYSYVQPAPAEHPDLFRVCRSTVYDSVLGTSAVTEYEYDSAGRLLCSRNPVGETSVYVWGYGGLYPVAQIQGAGLDAVLGVAGLSGLRTSPLEGALPAAVEASLRSMGGVDVTTWEYSPLVGLTAETLPDGRKTTYTYNASGKLHEVLDDLGRKKEATLYSTDNKVLSAQ